MHAEVGIQARTELGGYLRAERELQRIPLSEIADATKVPLRALQALEAGRWEGLPATIFVRGFVRAYARHLGIAAQAVQRFDDTLALVQRQEQQRVDPPVALPAATRDLPHRLGFALFVILLLIIATITFSVLWGSGPEASPRAARDCSARDAAERDAPRRDAARRDVSRGAPQSEGHGVG